MGRSLTSSAKSASNLLAARDNRQDALQRACYRVRAGQPAVVSSIVFLSLNIPGADKALPGTERLFSALCETFHASFPQACVLEADNDVLGPFALFQVPATPEAVKRACLGIESAQPAFRLADLDVYTPDEQQIGRGELGLARRTCLLCSEPAVDCMRLRTHDFAALVNRVHELLTPYRT